MVFKILFKRSDSVLFERKIEWLPVEGKDRNDAISIFNKYLGIPYNYSIIDVSIIEY